MNVVAQMALCEVPLSRKCAGYRGGNNVDIVGVNGSIPFTPTIHSKAFSGIYIVAGRFDKPEPSNFARSAGSFPLRRTDME